MPQATPLPRSAATLLVFANPFGALDRYGQPSGAVRFDPQHGIEGSVHFVGVQVKRAQRDREPVRSGPFPVRDDRQKLWDKSFEYDLRPQALPHTDYHVQQIREGSLLPADEATAKLGRVPFVPPEEAFARARAAAIAKWVSRYQAEPPVADWPEFVLLDRAGKPLAAPKPEASPETAASASAEVLPAPAAASLVETVLSVGQLPETERPVLLGLARFGAGHLEPLALTQALVGLALLFLPATPLGRALVAGGLHARTEEGPRPVVAVLGELAALVLATPERIALVPTQSQALLRALVALLPPDTDAAGATEILGTHFAPAGALATGGDQ